MVRCGVSKYINKRVYIGKNTFAQKENEKLFEQKLGV
jgi:hypothetical protein